MLTSFITMGTSQSKIAGSGMFGFKRNKAISVLSVSYMMQKNDKAVKFNSLIDHRCTKNAASFLFSKNQILNNIYLKI